MSPAELLDAALTAADVRQALHVARDLAGQPEAVPPLLPLLAAVLADVRPGTARRAAQIHGALAALALDNLPALLAALGNPRWTVREAVVHALGRVAPDRDAVRSALVHRVLFDRTAGVRELALAILQTGAVAALPEVRPALSHIHPRVRCRALQALSRLATPDEQAAALLSALDDSHFRVRRDAARLLGPLGSAALPALSRLARRRFDGEPRVAAAAANSLAQIAPALSPELADWLALLTATPDPVEALRAALQSSEWPLALQESVVAVCKRRREWFAGRKGAIFSPSETGPAALVEAVLAAAGNQAGREAVRLIGFLVAERARHHHGATR